MRIFFLLIVWSFCACSNYIGNPHARPLPPKVVPAIQGDLRVEPANWWVGMKHRRVEILVHREDIGAYSVRLGKTTGVKLLKTEKAESPNYLFVTLELASNAKPQKVPIIFTKGSASLTHEYPLLARNTGPKAQGIDARDVVYLLFPDRFANGDPSNDNVAGMLQPLDRDSVFGRHGGDLKGVMDRLDYLKDLGITSLWMTPELENDQDDRSYHGYAVTDHYRIDRRFGTNELYRDLVREAHKKGLKIIRDVVLNHIGINHYWMKDLPSRDWVNQWPEFTRTTYRAPTLVDPYASEYDLKHFNDGWFDTKMPDLNQRNPHVAQYLIQQAIWWVEYAGIDGLRIDTYTYSDQAFCSRWCKELKEEFPGIGMFGEIWEHGVSIQGYFADDQPMGGRGGFDSNLPGVIDFQAMFAIHEALTRQQGWTEGAARVYYTLAKDRFYKDPMKNVLMLDNHDFTRFFSIVGENMDKYKSGMAFLLTMRGIPQLYYATEIAMPGLTVPNDGHVRYDFPGGWPGDKADKFTEKGRNARDNEAFNFTRTLIRYRNSTPALQTGKLMQFVPVDGVYTYFRYDAAKTVMVVLNTADKAMTLDTKRFAERMNGFSRAKNVVTGAAVDNLGQLTIPKNSPLVLELVR
jgi:neopullulanase